MHHVKYRSIAFLAIILTSLTVLRARAADTPRAKIRVIATTDGEIDDRCSMVRFLLYADQWDIKGIILSSSKYHWKGDRKHPAHGWEGETWIQDQLDRYAKVFPRLRENNPGYPTPDYLRKQVYIGNVKYVGEMDEETPGSKRIVQVLLDPDPSPVWLQAWGGANTIARALKTIEQRHPDRVAEVTKKVRLFLITQQDQTWQDYIRAHWPKAQVMICEAFGAIAYRWRDIMTLDQQKYFDAKWMNAHILKKHGPLCAVYEANPNGDFRSEGDSPAFMHLIDVGLGSAEDPSYGGWGGRYSWSKDHWDSARDDDDKYETILRWSPAFQNDWAARADWCVKPFTKCNHAPVAVCDGDRTRSIIWKTVDTGATVTLDAAGSKDPDKNQLSYRWWVYVDAGTYWDVAPMTTATAERATLTVPSNASGRTIHVILEVTDDGKPPLTAYRRVILNVRGKPVTPPPTRRLNDVYLRTPIKKLDGPTDANGRWSFYRGFNLNGPAITIDGHLWQGDNATDLACKDRPLTATDVPLLPPTDSARAKMIHSFRWNGKTRITISNVPAGTYAVHAYLWEDNNPVRFAILLNGRIVARRYRSGVKGEWHRAGPWIVRVTKGKIEIQSRGGAANVSGVEIWQQH